VRRSFEALALPLLELPGYEADDILATAARRLHDTPIELVLVTADKDALQLVGPRVTVLSVLGRTGERVLYDAAKVEEKWGVPPARIPDILALMGDSIDNIPGVPGVGEVTAQKLLREFGSLEALYANLAVVTGPKLRDSLAKNRDQAFLSRQLAVLEGALPIEFDLERIDQLIAQEEATLEPKHRASIEYRAIADRYVEMILRSVTRHPKGSPS
jgi:DNA polymerase-1